MDYQTAKRIEELPTSVNYPSARFGYKRLKILRKKTAMKICKQLLH